MRTSIGRFRAAHSLKGAAAMVGLGPVAEFTHGIEAVLDRIRGGMLAVDSDIITTLLEARDHLATMVEAEAAKSPIPPSGELTQRLVLLRAAWLKWSADGRVGSKRPAGFGGGGRRARPAISGSSTRAKGTAASAAQPRGSAVAPAARGDGAAEEARRANDRTDERKPVPEVDASEKAAEGKTKRKRRRARRRRWRRPLSDRMPPLRGNRERAS